MSASSRSLPWIPAFLVVIITVAAHSLLLDYGSLHTAVLSHHYAELGDEVKHHLFGLLEWLQIYRLCAAILAVACAIWALFSRPRWVGIVAVALSLIVVLEAMIVM